jgi:integrase
VGEWWARWFPAVDLAPGTLEAYAQQYQRHVGPRFARVRLDEVTALDLSQFARSLREQGLAPSSVAVAMAVIRDLLVDAAAQGLIAAAPVGGIRRRGAGRGGPVRAGVAAELGTVLAVRGRLPEQEALMALTAVYTGMRWGEVCGMRTGTLRLPPARLGVGGGVYEVDAQLGSVHEDVHARRYFGPPKDGRGRVIDLPVFLAELLQARIEAVDGRTLIFANRHGEPIRHTDFLRLWRAACDGRPARYGRGGELREPAESPLHSGLRFHDLRHTHKTMLTELGVPEVLQDERLGHHPPGMRGVYAHTTRRMREELVDGLQGLWERELTRDD